MNAIVFERVPVVELPPEWRARLSESIGATVTVRIETEQPGNAEADAADPLFGMWRDRKDFAGVAGHVRGIRAGFGGDIQVRA